MGERTQVAICIAIRRPSAIELRNVATAIGRPGKWMGITHPENRKGMGLSLSPVGGDLKFKSVKNIQGYY